MSASERGFASMNKEKHKAIASKGGIARHKLRVGHYFTSEEARAAAIKMQAMRKAKREGAKVD